MSDKLETIKEQMNDALASWEESNGGKITNGWLHAANPVAISELLAELEEKDRRIAELEQRLQRPVKLPPLMIRGFRYNNAITACSMSIREAGFKSECTVFDENKTEGEEK